MNFQNFRHDTHTRTLSLSHTHTNTHAHTHRHRNVVESAFDALACAFDKWRRYYHAQEHSRMLEDRLIEMQRTLRRALLSQYLAWWSLLMCVNLGFSL
jgi:hypothetical protein